MTDFKDIKAFVFDVDGVLTDGSIYAIKDDLIRCYDSKDCQALRMASMNGYCLGIISGGVSELIVNRFQRCGFVAEDIYLGSRKKVEALEDFCKRHRLEYKNVMYFGDDLPDIPPMVKSGIGACPSDAVAEVKDIADYISPYAGGHQFVRDTLEKVMRSQGKWILDLDLFKAKF